MAQRMIDLAEENITSAIEPSLRPSVEQVKLKAQSLIQYATILQTKYLETTMEKIAAANASNEIAILNFSKKYLQAEEDYLELMEKVFDFQNTVNAFLGQQIIMTFVYVSPKSGQVTLYKMNNSVDELTLDRAASSRGGYITGRLSTLKKIKQSGAVLTDSSYAEKEGLDNTFQEVWQRYRISKSHLKMGGAAYILWKIDEWDGVWISGAGPLGEAYLAFFLNKYVFSNDLEPDVKTFMLNKSYGAINADNASGFLSGDVESDAAQFGVKMRGAQPLSYLEIIQYAQEILNTSDLTQYLQQLKQKLKQEGSQNMVHKLANLSKLEVDGLKNTISKRIDAKI